MKFIMLVLGYLTGKTKVTCITCNNLKDNTCYGKIPITTNEQIIPRVCGFWLKKKI